MQLNGLLLHLRSSSRRWQPKQLVMIHVEGHLVWYLVQIVVGLLPVGLLQEGKLPTHSIVLRHSAPPAWKIALQEQGTTKHYNKNGAESRPNTLESSGKQSGGVALEQFLKESAMSS